MKYTREMFVGNEEGIVDIPDNAIIVSSTIQHGTTIDEVFRLVVTALVPVVSE